MVVARLAYRNMRRRPVSAALLLMALCTATTTVGAAVALDAAAEAPWDRTSELTRGPDVLVTAGPDGAGTASLRDGPDVVEASGLWPVLFVAGEVGDRRQDVVVVGRAAAAARVDQPSVTAGRWVGDRGVVIERSFAEALGVAVGDPVELAGRTLRVRGVAATVTRGAYPLTSPGLTWVTMSLAAELAPDATLRGSQFALRLSDPARANGFAAAGAGGGVLVEPWQQLRADALEETRTTRVVLLTTSGLLVLVTVASVAVVVAGRMLTQARQVGTLKAVGMTPGQVARVVLVEYLALALLAAAVGVVVGSRLARVVAAPSSSLLGASETPAVTWVSAWTVAAVATLVVAVATVSPAVRGARESTLRTLVPGVGPTRLGRAVGGWVTAARLPIPVALGVRSALRRPRQAALAVGSLTLALSMVVAALAMERSFQVEAATTSDVVAGGHEVLTAAQAVSDDRLRALVYSLTGVMLALGLVNALIVAVFAARDSAANHARLRAVGVTPRQTVVAVVTSQVTLALVAAVVAVPLGAVIFRLAYSAANGSSEGAQLPPVAWVLPAVVLTGLLAAALAGPPARWMARRPVAKALAYE